LEQREQREQQQNNDHPKGEIAQVGVHPVSFMAAGQSATRSFHYARNIRPIHVRPDHNLCAKRAPANGT
jgi:hypothetical protein